jgi:asparagine synthetase B (glutamine-hydrolysing)
MFVGLYNCAGASVRELAEFPRLAALAAEPSLLVRGPLGMVATAGAPASAVSVAELGATLCVIDGHLYEQPIGPARDVHASAPSDAESLAHAYGHHRTGFLSTARGRYAAALWDNAANRGLLTCDILATRPVFFFRRGGALLFAGEVHEVLSLATSRPGPDRVAFVDWLADGTCPEGRTLYEGVARLGPGELIELAPGSPSPRRYWRPRFQDTMNGGPGELADGLRARLRKSTKGRLSAGVNAVILSGGLDSSIVTAVAERELAPGASLRTYSGVFPGMDFDESAKIRQLTEALGVDASTLEIEPQGTLWLALHHTKRWQLPLIAAGSLIDIATTRQAAGDGAEMILDGQTGDELFGFSPYLVADRLRRGRLLAAIALAGRWPIGRATTVRDKRWILTQLGIRGAVPHRVGRFVRARRDLSDEGPPWLLPRFRHEHVARADRWAWKLGASGPLWWRYLADTLVAAPHRELRLDYLRHRAAAEGVVSESPLYDADLIDYTLRLPPELAFDARFDRPLVREAMRDWLPSEIRLQTKKADFTRFCLMAVTGADAAGFDDLLGAPDAEIGAYVDLEQVRNGWSELRARKRSSWWLGAVWRLAAAECWLRSQSDAGFADRLLGDSRIPAPSIRSVALTG